MLWLRECADRGDVGPKARRLAQAMRLGLRVPDGIVLLPEEAFSAELLRKTLASLTPPLAPGSGRFAVRSSSTQEDLPGRSAAGLFLSRLRVRLEEVADAVAAVRESGNSEAVRLYCGAAVPVAVLIQPMVIAERLGVLYLDLYAAGSAVCEERPAAAPEWAQVTTRALPPDDPSPLAKGARRLTALLAEEAGSGAAAYIEYALLPDGEVTFLQVRPAPPAPPPPEWPPLSASLESDELLYVHDQEHNPDPLSRAQSGLVEGVADLVPTLRQRVYRGYLYYADVPGAEGRPLIFGDLGEHYARDIEPACEALLSPLERRLAAADGALDEKLLADPALAPLELDEVFAAYRGVYQLYVAQLGPALRRARQALDELLRHNLGESLQAHGSLLAAAAEAPTERLQHLWEMGQKGAPTPLLRAYLRRYGAFAACWDIAAPCEDEQPERMRDAALRLAAGTTTALSPQELHQAALHSYAAARTRLCERLPAYLHAELERLLPQARTAQRIAEEDDALFFRAQRLVRWALLRRGALLVRAGRLEHTGAIFDLPWALHTAHFSEFDVKRFAPDLDLSALAAEGAHERAAARGLVPPSRLIGGQPLWTPPRAAVLMGHGVAPPGSGPLRGRARVLRTLFPSDPAQADIGEDTILVLPALLPSWAVEVWRARALITDSGGALSHGAILARERGVPAVVGTRVATRTIADGQELWVDAARDRVYLLPMPPLPK